MNSLECFVVLRTMDFLWKDHLAQMQELRQSVRLRAYGQKDPLVEYKREGHYAFRALMDNIESEIAERIMRVSVPKKIRLDIPRVVLKNGSKNKEFRAGRNDPCPCGSGKKYKKCHGK